MTFATNLPFQTSVADGETRCKFWLRTDKKANLGEYCFSPVSYSHYVDFLKDLFLCLYWIFYNIFSVFCFGFLAMGYVGS